MSSFTSFIQNELNDHQRTAVISSHPATMVIAGAGSGKTRVITARIAHLMLESKTDPASIIALTFTNKAAGEMKERLTSFLGADETLPFIGTFHSYCLKLLRTNPDILPFPSFSILDSDDQLSLLKKIIKQNGLEKQITASAMSHMISMAKNKLFFDAQAEVFARPLFKEIYIAYEAEKSASHCLDFDDLLVQTLSAFENNDAFRSRFQAYVKHILVDEYQDTSFVQHALLKVMALAKPARKNAKPKLAAQSICAVGDQDQSIYSWRGAVVTNMITFQDDFAPVDVVKIEQNYRSVQPILKAANALISCNTQRHEKKLWSDKKASGRILVTNCQSGYQEADVLISTIKMLQTAGKKLDDIAVLYRTHFQSRSLEESLIRNGIGYHIVGGIRFYERKEIKDVLAYLRLIVNPFDRTSLFRIINYPTRGLGAKFEEQLFHEWQQQPMFNFKQILSHLLHHSEKKVTGLKAQTLQAFINIFDGLEPEQSASELVATILQRTGYLEFMRRTLDPKQADTKQENVREFIQSIKHFEKEHGNDAPLEDFLHEIALMQQKMAEDEDREHQITLMTLHAVKGLEFDTVFITGLEEGLLPSSRSLHSTQALEEERRLFYVGMTRAKEHLILLHANYRNTYGSVSDQLTSRFISELPSRLIRTIDLSETSLGQYNQLCADWLGITLKSDMQTYAAPQQKLGIKKPIRSLLKKKKQTLQRTANNQQQEPTCPWKKNQTVTHATFGAGMITNVEKKNGEYHLTILFRVGQKKIASRFIKPL